MCLTFNFWLWYDRSMKQNTVILEKMNEIEKELQALKLEYFFTLPKKQKDKTVFYKDKDILREVKKARKKLWDEKYSKAV